MVAATALVAHAADNAGSVDGMLPTDGTLKRGAQVRLAMLESFKPCVQELTEALQKLAPEKRDAFVKSFTLISCRSMTKTSGRARKPTTATPRSGESLSCVP